MNGMNGGRETEPVAGRVLVASLTDRPGALQTAISMFRARGINIRSLVVGHSEEPGMSRATIVVEGAERLGSDQAVLQLSKLIPVIEASDVTGGNFVGQAMAMLDVGMQSNKGRHRILDVLADSGVAAMELRKRPLVVAIMGDEDAIGNAIQSVRSLVTIRTMVQSGLMALEVRPIS